MNYIIRVTFAFKTNGNDLPDLQVLPNQNQTKMSLLYLHLHRSYGRTNIVIKLHKAPAEFYTSYDTGKLPVLGRRAILRLIIRLNKQIY